MSALPDSVIAKPLRKPAPSSPAAPTPDKDHRTVPGAVKAALPAKLQPRLATLATGVPVNGDWLYEIKFDGYRIMARLEAGKVALHHPRRP